MMIKKTLLAAALATALAVPSPGFAISAPASNNDAAVVALVLALGVIIFGSGLGSGPVVSSQNQGPAPEIAPAEQKPLWKF